MLPGCSSTHLVGTFSGHHSINHSASPLLRAELEGGERGSAVHGSGAKYVRSTVERFRGLGPPVIIVYYYILPLAIRSPAS